MFSRLSGKKREKSEPTTELTIPQCKANLIDGTDADISARTLGDIAIERKDRKALLALWEAICETNHLAAIIDPCAYTVGRIVWETLDPTLEDIGFDIFSKSIGTRSELIVDKFAYIVGEVVLRTRKDKTRQRARKFVNDHALSTDPLVRVRYVYTKDRITRRLADNGKEVKR
jgi:hypothetical protein